MLTPSWQGRRRGGCRFSTALPQIAAHPNSGSCKGDWAEMCPLPSACMSQLGEALADGLCAVQSSAQLSHGKAYCVPKEAEGPGEKWVIAMM